MRFRYAWSSPQLVNVGECTNTLMCRLQDREGGYFCLIQEERRLKNYSELIDYMIMAMRNSGMVKSGVVAGTSKDGSGCV